MSSFYTQAKLGDLYILVTEVSTAIGRDVAVQSPETGGVHASFDRGQQHGVSNVEILFCDQPGMAPYLTRFDTFKAMLAKTSSYVFTHPILGSGRVKVENASAQAASGESCVRVTCAFVPDEEPKMVTPVSAGVVPTVGADAVVASASVVNTLLGSIGLSNLAASATLAASTAQGWANAVDLDTAQVLLEASNRVTEIDNTISQLGPSLDNWEAFRALILLRYSVGKAAESFTSDTEMTFTLYVDKARPLLVICSELYGAADAPDRAEKAAKRNRVRTPGRVPAGTNLIMEVPGPG
jgi:hypothetical protein